MKKKNALKQIPLCMCIMLMANVCSSYASTSNTVYLYKGDGVSDLQFNYEGNNVTSGESHDDKLDDNDQHDDYLYLQFHADRKGSTSIANSFNNEINYDQNATLGLKAMTDLPDKMNFYFYGQLYINGNVVIQKNSDGSILSARNRLGQTHQDDRNNWWINSVSEFLKDDPSMQQLGIVDFDSDNYMSVVTDSGSGNYEQYCISQHDDDYYKFTISRCGLGNRVTFNKKDDVNSVSLTMSDEGLQVPTHTENGNIVGDIAYYPTFTKFWDEDDKTNYLVNVERKISKDLATAYNAIVGTESNMIGLGDPLNIPDDLYFYFGARMKINDSPVINTVYFGEGNENGSDWWAGTAGGVRDNNQLLVYTEDGQQYCLSQEDESNDTFNIGRCDNGSGDSDTTIHDNTVKLYPGSGVQTLQFNMSGFRVSDGQPYQDSLAKNEMIDGYLELDFQAGRKKDNKIAESYVSSVGKLSEYGRNTDADYPDELNFYINGPLEINGSPVINEVYLGQGSNDSGNNWWFGTKGAWRESDRDLIWVKTQDDKNYCISNGNEGEYSFMISDKCPDGGTTPLTNEVEFYLNDGVNSVKVEMDQTDKAKVTAGQPHADILSYSRAKDSDSYVTMLNSGRHGSESLAESLNMLIDNGDSIISINADGIPESPDSLNFYFPVRLTINGSEVEDKIYLGQMGASTCIDSHSNAGSKCDITNVWWLGSQRAEKIDKTHLKLKTKDGHTYKIYGKGYLDDDAEYTWNNLFGIEKI